MYLTEALDLPPDRPVVLSLTGGGGKTSTLYALARELKLRGKNVLVTTTTAIYMPESDRYDHFFLVQEGQLPNHPESEKGSGSITVAGSRVTDEGKLKGVDREWVDALYGENLFDVILVEADGAKGRPVKAPDLHEPVIPSCTAIVVGVIGLDCYGKVIGSEWVHRPRLLAGIAGKSEGELIDGEVLVKLAGSPDGLFKSCPGQADKVMLLNKAGNGEDRIVAEKIGNRVMGSGCGIKRVLIGSVLETVPIRTVLLNNDNCSHDRTMLTVEEVELP